MSLMCRDKTGFKSALLESLADTLVSVNTSGCRLLFVSEVESLTILSHETLLI